MTQQPTILVFDSGLGGLTVLREIVRSRPDLRAVYAADDAFFPYGHHSEDEIIARAVPLVGDLIAAHAPDLVVIACNTMSVSALAPLRAAYSVPFVGTVPAIKPACAQSKTKRVSVLATAATVRRDYTFDLIREFAGDCRVTLRGAERLAGFAEDLLRGIRIDGEAVRAEIEPCFIDDGARTDTVVLACTHYPLILPQLEQCAPWPVTWIDPAPAIARRASQLLGAEGTPVARPAKAYFTSGNGVPPVLAGALAEFRVVVAEGLPAGLPV